MNRKIMLGAVLFSHKPAAMLSQPNWDHCVTTKGQPAASKDQGIRLPWKKLQPVESSAKLRSTSKVRSNQFLANWDLGRRVLLSVMTGRTQQDGKQCSTRSRRGRGEVSNYNSTFIRY